MKKTAMPQNFKAHIDWVLGAYELVNVTLSDGFQKDSIQNASGAREKDNWQGWKCKIDLVTNELGTFLLVEDEGTEGLTGPNLSATEITEMIEDQVDIDPNWRLARFSSRNVSGGNQTGAGQYGVGKSVYSAASKNYDYCFDSLRKDGIYVANRNEAGQIFEQALEGDEAKNYIIQTTGLPIKETIGTRIIVFNPKEEICDSIKSGELASFIQESWWRCIEKMPLDSGIFLNGTRVDLPELGEFDHKYQTSKPELYVDGYRVKKFGFFIKKIDNPNNWQGISYYRKGMKIGNVDLSDIPNSIKDRFWGYLEVDKEWEEALADIEDTVHYGVKSGKKHTTTYQNMRLYCSKKVNPLLVEWGYIKDKEFEDKKLQEALKEISEEVQDLFEDLGFEDLGKGPKKPDFSVYWKDIKYPHEDTPTVLSGEEIEYGFIITNGYLTAKKFKYSIKIISKVDDHTVSTIEDKSVNLSPGESYKDFLTYTVSPSTAQQYEENRIVLTVQVGGSTKEKRKELPFFYNIEKPDNSHRQVLLTLHSLDLPHENSLRVNFGETIKNVEYLVENKRAFPLEFSLNIGLHDGEDEHKPLMKTITTVHGSAAPFEDVLISDIPDIMFNEEELSPYLTSGIIELRARLTALADSDEFEKGDRITHFHQKLFLNKNEKNGKSDSFEARTINEPENYRRSWCKGGSRLIFINSGHPAYKSAQESDEDWRNYLKQEILKQYVLLYLDEGKYSMFGNGTDITTMDPIEAGKCIMDKIEEVYQQSFK